MPLAEKLVSGFAALVAILWVIVLSRWLIDDAALPYIVASMGASAVLLFALPQGPLSQPWPFAGGHLISAAIGVTCAQWVPNVLFAAALAVAMAISAMYVLRCLHPPGGATAMTVVLGGDVIRSLGYAYLLSPLLMNIVMMLAWALLINNLLPRRHYPNFIRQLPQNDHALSSEVNMKAHVHAALNEVDTFIDASEEDLGRLFNVMLTQERRERMGEIACRDIMCRDVTTAEYDTELEVVWAQMIQGHFRSMPVLDQRKQVIGMLSMTDFLRQVVDLPKHDSLLHRLKHFVKRTEGLHANKIEYAGHLMSKQVVSIQADQHIVDLFPLFVSHGVHHIPVIDEQNRLQGLITPKQLLSALHSDLLRYKTDALYYPQ